MSRASRRPRLARAPRGGATRQRGLDWLAARACLSWRTCAPPCRGPSVSSDRARRPSACPRTRQAPAPRTLVRSRRRARHLLIAGPTAAVAALRHADLWPLYFSCSSSLARRPRAATGCSCLGLSRRTAAAPHDGGSGERARVSRRESDDAGPWRTVEETSGSVCGRSSPRAGDLHPSAIRDRLRGLALRVGEDERLLPASGGSRGSALERDAAEKRHPSSAARCSPPPVPKTSDVMFSIYAEELHLVGAPSAPPARDLLGERLRRRHDDGLGAGQHLPERDRHVAGARAACRRRARRARPSGRPGGTARARGEHRAAPHQRLVVVDEEADRHELQVVRDGRDHQPIDEHGLLLDPEHVRDRWP